MLKNYFKTAWRNLKTNKFYSLINISGLAIGLTTSILLLLWVQHERSFDRFHKDYENIYQVSTHFGSHGGITIWPSTPAALATFAKDIPQISELVRITDEFDQVLSNANRNKVMDGHHIAFVDSTFFQMFSFNLLEGNQAKSFPDIYSVIITKSLANKLFEKEQALGQILIHRGTPFTVSGILEDFPDNSTIHFDALFPMGFYGKAFTARGGNGAWKTIDEDLGNYNFQTFIKLNPQTNSTAVADALTLAQTKARNGEGVGELKFQLQPLANLHLTGTDGNNNPAKMVHIFMITAILILVIAAINYINLSTARSLDRAREVSIRKVIGANARQLFFQFILETLLIFIASLVVAIVLIIALTPVYNQISGKNLHFSIYNREIWNMIGYTAIGMFMATSLYPAYLLASFQPIAGLKGKINVKVGTSVFRKSLVVCQFSISVLLIVATIIMGRQMEYLRTIDLGYDQSYVFTVPLTPQGAEHKEALKTQLKNTKEIIDVSASDIYDIANLSSASGDLEWNGKAPNSNLIVGQANVDKDFIPTLKIDFLEGGNFTGTPIDSASFILNETAVLAMGLQAPYTGQPLTFHGKKGHIIGVVKDFNFKSLKEKTTPLVLYSWWNGNILHIRSTAKGITGAIASARQEYAKYAGDIPFSFSFVDNQIETQYHNDRRISFLFNLFAGVAIFISCLGLFGLATYNAQIRIKEIGIRKVLGANIGSIVQLLNKETVWLILVAILIASPLAWWALNKWLQGFAYRIELQWWMFAAAGSLAMLIALLTVSTQAIRAARMNPIKSLRNN